VALGAVLGIISDEQALTGWSDLWDPRRSVRARSWRMELEPEARQQTVAMSPARRGARVFRDPRQAAAREQVVQCRGSRSSDWSTALFAARPRARSLALSRGWRGWRTTSPYNGRASAVQPQISFS